MRKKQYIILVILLIIIVALIFVLRTVSSNKEAEEEAEEEAATVYVTDFDAEDVVAFSYYYSYEQFEFELNEDGEWYYTDDDETTWDQDLITSMVETLATITADYTIESPEDVSEYGLDTFYQLIEIEFSDGTTMELQFGAANEVVGGYYVIVSSSDDDTVYLVSEDVYTTFQVDIYDLVEDTEAEDDDTDTDTEDTEDTTEEE